MSQSMGMGVSEKIFVNKFKGEVKEDVFANEFHAGELRGKIKGNKLYMYISDDGPKSFTTVLRGKFDSRDITYHFSKPRAAIMMTGVASLAWLVFALILFFMNGPAGLLPLIAIPIIMFPMFRKNKEEMSKLEKQLRRLAH